MSRRPLWEMVLDPRTIHWLLGLGGGLLVLGLVTWLAVLGVFNDAAVVAVALGAANAVVLGGGWALIRWTRHQLAGRAITLLACLVMPLNLWFEHVNGLVTLDGHLWLAALVCCSLYLASALVLRDPLFVYVFGGGIAMTGLLMLADAGRFWEIASPAAMLVVLGLAFLHVERAFPIGEGPFSRRQFGLAFFHSGHVLLAAGLLLTFGAQLTGDWLYQPLFQPLYQLWRIGPPTVVTEHWWQWLSLGLVLTGCYAYFYSDIVVRRVGWYVYPAVFCLLWAELLVVELFFVPKTPEVVLFCLALTALVAHWLELGLLRARGQQTPAAASLILASRALGLFLCTAALLLGLALLLQGECRPLGEFWTLSGNIANVLGWPYIVAMLTTAAACRVGAQVHRHDVGYRLPAIYFFGATLAAMSSLIGVLSIVGIRTWNDLAPLLMLVPIVQITISRMYRGRIPEYETSLAQSAQATTTVLVVGVLAVAFQWTPPSVFNPPAGLSLNLYWAAFFAEVAVFYALAGVLGRQAWNGYPSVAAGCTALWQVFQYWQISAEHYPLVFALLGLALLTLHRLSLLKTESAFRCANIVLSLSLVGSALMTLSRMAVRPQTVDGSLTLLLLSLWVVSLSAAWIVRRSDYRRWYLVLAVVEAGLALLAMYLLSRLTMWEKVEIFSILVGMALLAIGHVGWHREEDNENGEVSFCLLFGSLAIALPLTIAVLIHRGNMPPEFSTLNELGLFLMGVVLFCAGVVCQIRATAIAGAAMLIIDLLSLILYVNMLQNVQTVAIWCVIGGGTLFTTAILLSIYRDRLLELPGKISRREGVFRVLNWR